MRKIISIKGMMCKHCSDRVKNALNSLEGVVVESIKLDEKEAIVICEKSDIDNILKEAIEDKGYTVNNIE
jgi:Cu+-exporting ATPase